MAVREVTHGAVREVAAHRSECRHCSWRSKLMTAEHLALDLLDYHVADEHQSAMECPDCTPLFFCGVHDHDR